VPRRPPWRCRTEALHLSAAAAERVARESYGRLVALLASRTRDVAAAEDALADAFAAALRVWPAEGAPLNPEAWLFAAAKRRLIDGARRAATAKAGEARVAAAIEEIEADMRENADIPDRRLGLMFACAHPAIDPGVRTALMLQTVLGLTADRIAAAFLVEPAAMGQRLVRAKTKIRDSGVPFAIPAPLQWPERIGAVLDAIYAAYGEGWTDAGGERRALAEEAIWLGRVLAQSAPEEPEALGLLALMLHLEARRAARRDAEGRYVPLADQDCARWNRAAAEEAERLLRRAAAMGQIGRYQLEAAIQSAHAARAWAGVTDWSAIVTLYDALVALTGSPVAKLNRIAARAQVDGAAAGLAELEALGEALAGYQPYWALRAHLLARNGQPGEARAAYAEAIARERDVAVIAHLEGQMRATVEAGA
jgi:RNA polymerase sigma-70 factor (ECF subfamily)